MENVSDLFTCHVTAGFRHGGLASCLVTNNLVAWLAELLDSLDILATQTA